MVSFEVRFAFFAINILFLFLWLALTSPCMMHYYFHFTDGQAKLRAVMWLPPPPPRPSLCFVCSCTLEGFPNLQVLVSLSLPSSPPLFFSAGKLSSLFCPCEIYSDFTSSEKSSLMFPRN